LALLGCSQKAGSQGFPSQQRRDAKLQKTILKGLKGGKSVASLAEEFGISKPYVYMLKNKG
jgi:DNA-binding CsgD family transcriptional regulator